MSIGNFKETSEGNDNNESRMENSEKKSEQKAESTEKRNENVDSKMDEHESKQEKQSEDKENKKDASDDSQKQKPWEKFTAFFKKDGGENKNAKEDVDKEVPSERDRVRSFKEQYKVDVSESTNQENTEKRNKPTEDEGKGQRERSLDER